VGIFGHWIDSDLGTFEIAADRLRMVEVFRSVPDAALVARARQSGDALVARQVGSPQDACAAQDAGCDFVIAQGIEADGHVRGTVLQRVSRLDRLGDQLDHFPQGPNVRGGGVSSRIGCRAKGRYPVLQCVHRPTLLIVSSECGCRTRSIRRRIRRTGCDAGRNVMR
jgi:hypothetical protein